MRKSDFLQAIAYFFEGFGHRMSDNSSFGTVTALEVARDACPSPANPESYRDGVSAADLVSAAQGIAEIVGGPGTLIGAAVGGTVCVGLSSGGCLAIAVPLASAVVATAGAGVIHGSAMLAKAVHWTQHGKTTGAHHPWPEYLGWSRYQPLYEMDRALHQKYHRALDKAVRRRWNEKIDLHSQSQPQLAEYFKQLRKSSHYFDAANGTETLKYLEQAIKEGGYK